MTIRVPAYMNPQPWKHFLAWVVRGGVPTYDYIPAWAGDNLREEVERYKSRHEESQGRIDQLILDHTPSIYQPERLTSGWGYGSKVELKCGARNCPYMWPCPTFAWATGRRYKQAHINLNDFEIVEEDE